MKKTKGFTLIELLVVITLISILSGIILGVINVGGIQKKSRDARRAADLKKVQTALELYFSDNRAYLASGWQVLSSGGTVGSALKTGNYISVIPTDPSTSTGGDPCTSTNVGYWYYGTVGSYVLATNMEVASSDATSKCSDLNNWSKLSLCAAPGNCYGVENPF